MSQKGLDLSRRMFVPRILHISFVFTLILYALVAELMPNQSTQTIEMLPWILAAVAVVEAMALPILRQKVMPERKEGSEPLPEELPPRAHQAFGQYFTAQILSWALCESIAIYGLICAIMTGEPIYYYPFGAGSLILIALLTPRRADLEGIVRAVMTE